jgi:hypothetical protein
MIQLFVRVPEIAGECISKHLESVSFQGPRRALDYTQCLCHFFALGQRPTRKIHLHVIKGIICPNPGVLRPQPLIQQGVPVFSGAAGQ